MKKPFISLTIYFLLALMIVGLNSCEDDFFENYEMTDGANKFAAVYRCEDDFLKGSNAIKLNSEIKYKNEHITHEKNRGMEIPLYLDIRQNDGYSFWGSKNLDLKCDEEKSRGKTVFSQSEYTHDVIVSNIPCTTPPAHLHLCLNSLRENPEDIIPGKTWSVGSIVDENGNSLADDSDWSNYTDNKMRFEKVNKFVYTPGEKRSETELDLFGTHAKNPTLTGTFSVTENVNKQVSLSLNFPKFPQKLEVVSSGWNTLQLKGTVNGKTGIMNLSPIAD